MKRAKLDFAPGAFDNFTGTQEELDALVLELQRLVDTGEIWNNLAPLQDLSEEEAAALSIQEDRILH